jgi:hypothetical protein
MPDALLTVRVPCATRVAIRAIAAVTGMPFQQVLVTAFAHYYARLPKSIVRQVELLRATRRRYEV